MKKPMMSAIIMLTIVILMATFDFSLDGTPPAAMDASVSGTTLFVCPVVSYFWDTMSASFSGFYRYIMIGFFFAAIVLMFMWGWALYQNLLQDKFKREDFAKPWGFTKMLFWTAVVIAIVIHTPNHFRRVTVDGRPGDWVLCENTSAGNIAVSADLVHSK